jgi:hypothetical protein
MAAMAVRIAGSNRPRRRALTRKRQLVSIAAVAIVVIIVVAWQMGALSTTAGKKPAAVVQQPLTTAAKQDEDVDLVAGAIGQYSAANGVLPTGLSATAGNGLVLCGSTCDATDYDVSGFSFYQASAFKITTYASGLTAPSQSVVYLVPGAKCGSNGQVGGINTDPRSMVLLYESVSSSGTTAPRCVVL